MVTGIVSPLRGELSGIGSARGWVTAYPVNYLKTSASLRRLIREMTSWLFI